MWWTKAQGLSQQDVDVLRETVDKLSQELQAVMRERDEAYVRLEAEQTARGEIVARLGELNTAYLRTLTELQDNAATVGEAIAERISATGMIGICKQVLATGRSTGAYVAGGLIEGYSKAKDAKAGES